jgi:hypothetical protein
MLAVAWFSEPESDFSPSSGFDVDTPKNETTAVESGG